MKIKGIISNPYEKKHRSYQIVFLWEKIISENYPLPIVNVKGWWYFVIRNINKIDFIKKFFIFLNTKIRIGGYYLFFCMDASIEYREFKLNRWKNILPIIIDYWIPQEKVQLFFKYHKTSRCLLITSKEVYVHLLSNKCPIPLVHFPLSIPDENIQKDFLFQPKVFDFLFPGRRDPVFFEYMLQYEKENPEIEYVYQELEDNIKPYYVSNKRGRLKEDFYSREGYLNLLRSSRITFYATPGLDPTKSSDKYNQVTPRFLELLASGCLVMGRYIKNPDTEYYNLERYCPLINNYDNFKETLMLFFDEKWTSAHITSYYDYLLQHTTTSRIPILKEIIKNI